jgi:Flp pilus assembly pilin Flp
VTLVEDIRGAVYTEYILIVMLIGLIVSAALIAIGVPIWRAFRMTQLFLGAPLP